MQSNVYKKSDKITKLAILPSNKHPKEIINKVITDNSNNGNGCVSSKVKSFEDNSRSSNYIAIKKEGADYQTKFLFSLINITWTIIHEAWFVSLDFHQRPLLSSVHTTQSVSSHWTSESVHSNII